MKAIVFGASGQDGIYLSQLLIDQNISVFGVSRSGRYINGNISDYRFVESLIRETKPNYIFHFAANSTTKHNALFENHDTICTGTLNILEAVYKYSPKSKVFLSGSAMQFKNDGLPIHEHTEFEGNSPYSVARIHSIYAGRYYRDKLGLKVYVGYFFNHDSPLRAEIHVNQKIVRSIHRILEGNQNNLELGDINVQKEFGFAGDVVQAVWQLVNQEDVFEAVIGTGVAFKIKDWVERCFALVGLNWNEYVLVINDFKPEYNILVSKPTLIKSLGWQPITNIDKLAELMMLKK